MCCGSRRVEKSGRLPVVITRSGWSATSASRFGCTPPSFGSAYRKHTFFPYDPAWRFEARIEPAEPEPIELNGFPFTRFARARVTEAASLDLYWLETYGGGIFLPFRDATSGGETYGAGRYLLDTVKGADLGGTDTTLVVDFNFAYNPSCAWDDAWACPLSPPANRLDFEVAAGELTPT